MATRRLKISAGETLEQVVEEVGAATNSDTVELTIDLATTAVNDAGSTRGISRAEVIEALEKFKNYLIKANWPLA